MRKERKTRFLEMRRSRRHTSRFGTTITALLLPKCKPLQATARKEKTEKSRYATLFGVDVIEAYVTCPESSNILAIA